MKVRDCRQESNSSEKRGHNSTRYSYKSPKTVRAVRCVEGGSYGEERALAGEVLVAWRGRQAARCGGEVGGGVHTFHTATSPPLSPDTMSSFLPAARVRTEWLWHNSGCAAGSSSAGSQRRTSCRQGRGEGKAGRQAGSARSKAGSWQVARQAPSNAIY